MSKKPFDTWPFHLKQFSLLHHRSTMKVGTDAMILGVWTSVEDVHTILDIGTGCGILGLLLAYRSLATIDAIDIDRESVEEANENFSQPDHQNRITAFLADFNTYATTCYKKYDLIISNPPFFINDMKPEDLKRKTARHSDMLSYDQLCQGASVLLEENGKFSVVLPYEESRIFIDKAELIGLYPKRNMVIFPKEGALPNRINIEFSKKHSSAVISQKFTIRKNDLEFTQQYIDLLKDYYINLG